MSDHDANDDEMIDDEGEPIAVELSDADIVGNARRRHGALGAVMAAGMLGIDQVLGRKPREEAPVVISSNSDPHDVDTEGISFVLDAETSITAPPLPRTPPAIAPPRRRRSR